MKYIEIGKQIKNGYLLAFRCRYGLDTKRKNPGLFRKRLKIYCCRFTCLRIEITRLLISMNLKAKIYLPSAILLYVSQYAVHFTYIYFSDFKAISWNEANTFFFISVVKLTGFMHYNSPVLLFQFSHLNVVWISTVNGEH